MHLLNRAVQCIRPRVPKMKRRPNSPLSIDRIDPLQPRTLFHQVQFGNRAGHVIQTARMAQGMAALKTGPLSVTEWHDPKSSSVGWLVVDRRVNGVSGGGVFMWSGACLLYTSPSPRDS